MRLSKLTYHALLVSTFGSVLFILISSILLPLRKTPGFKTTYRFSNAFPTLSDWVYTNSQTLNDSSSKELILLDARQYQYHQHDLSLKVDMRYLIDSNAHLPLLFRQHTTTRPSLIAQHNEKGIGFYGVFTDEENVFLSACINSRGGSTVTSSQFAKNRLLHDLHPSWFVPWLLGQHPLRDNRCLWATLSISPRDLAPEDAYPLLEKAWFDVHRWWATRFPKP